MKIKCRFLTRKLSENITFSTENKRNVRHFLLVLSWRLLVMHAFWLHLLSTEVNGKNWCITFTQNWTLAYALYEIWNCKIVLFVCRLKGPSCRSGLITESQKAWVQLYVSKHLFNPGHQCPGVSQLQEMGKLSTQQKELKLLEV